jgi:hypothetical protein
MSIPTVRTEPTASEAAIKQQEPMSPQPGQVESRTGPTGVLRDHYRPPVAPFAGFELAVATDRLQFDHLLNHLHSLPVAAGVA